jgi:hypothetical protein
LASKLKKPIIAGILATSLTYRLLHSTIFLWRLSWSHCRVLRSFCAETKLGGRLACIRFFLVAIINHARLFEVLGTLSGFRASPTQLRLESLLRMLTPLAARDPNTSYPLTGFRAIKLNAAISRFSFRKWLNISICEADSFVLGRYSSACLAVVEFLKYAGVGDEDFSDHLGPLIEPFLEWSRRRHSLILGLEDTSGPIHEVVRRCDTWRGLCSRLWRGALWAAIKVYRLRLERLDQYASAQNREAAVDTSLDIKRRKVSLLAASSEITLRVMLATQLSVNALTTLLQIRQSDRTESPVIAGALTRAVTALDSNLEFALNASQEWR